MNETSFKNDTISLSAAAILRQFKAFNGYSNIGYSKYGYSKHG